MLATLSRAIWLLANLHGACMAAVSTQSAEDPECATNDSTWLLQVKTDVLTPPRAHGLRYIPEKNVLLCACPKCGSTSLFHFVYSDLFGKPWNYSDPPWIQGVSTRWEGKEVAIDREGASNLMEAPEVFSFALVRDPIARLISAWKSKLACDEECAVIDKGDRKVFVPGLLALAGNTSQATCLSLPDFVETLFSIHRQGKAASLNSHFIPQDLYCFKDIPIQKWDMVQNIENISNSTAAQELSKHLGNTTISSFPHYHSSEKQNCTSKPISETVRRRLDAITEDEYIALGMHPPTQQ